MTRSYASLVLIAGSILITSGQLSAIDEAESLALLVGTLDETEDSAVQTALMRGMLSGLAGRRNVPAPDAWSEVAAKLARSDDVNVRDLASQLSQVFGDQAAVGRALATVKDRSAPNDARRRALNSLLTQKNDQVSALLEPLLDEPELRLDAIRGFAAIENAKAPEILLKRYKSWSPEHRQAAIETLAARKRYAETLLNAIKSNVIPRKHVPAHVARSLSFILGDRFVEVFGDVRQLAEDRVKLMAKYKKMLSPEALADADAAKGRVIFKKTCASCHLLYGKGGKVGPDLTGSNRANLDYILLNSVDPSYDVPEGYKMVIIETVDGLVLNGVIDEENSQRVILKTAEKPKVVVLKSDIDYRQVSSKSIMPDGQLDQMKPPEVANLIKYLQTTEQVEIAQ